MKFKAGNKVKFAPGSMWREKGVFTIAEAAGSDGTLEYYWLEELPGRIIPDSSLIPTYEPAENTNRCVVCGEEIPEGRDVCWSCEQKATVKRYEPDQTVKHDAGKPRLTLVPLAIIWAIAKVRMYGLKKYGDSESWRSVEIERYRDAAFRHFLAYLDDPKGVDEESGLSHLAHLACNVAFLVEMEEEA